MPPKPEPVPATLGECWEKAQHALPGDLFRFAWRDKTIDPRWFTWTGTVEDVPTVPLDDATCGTVRVRFPEGSHRLAKAAVGKIIEWPSPQGRLGKIDYSLLEVIPDLMGDTDVIDTPPPERQTQETGRKRSRDDNDVASVILAQQDRDAGFRFAMVDLVPGLRIPTVIDQEDSIFYPHLWNDAGQALIDGLEKHFGTKNFTSFRIKEDLFLDEQVLIELCDSNIPRTTKRKMQILYGVLARIIATSLLCAQLGGTSASASFTATFHKGYEDGRLDMAGWSRKALRERGEKKTVVDVDNTISLEDLNNRVLQLSKVLQSPQQPQQPRQQQHQQAQSQQQKNWPGRPR